MNLLAVLFAEASPVPPRTGFFPDDFVPSLAMSVIFAAVAMVLFAVFWRVIHRITPGDLDHEILGSKDSGGTKQPNVALAIIVGAMILAFCWIIAAAIK